MSNLNTSSIYGFHGFYYIHFLFHKYQNKGELDNCIFESNVFNNNRSSLLMTLDSHTFTMLSVKVHIKPEMKNKILIHDCNSVCLQKNPENK